MYGSIAPQKPGTPPVVVNFAITPYGAPDKPISSGTFIAPSVAEQQYDVLLWTSGVISSQGVWFTMNVTSASTDNPFLFDYIVFNEQMRGDPSVLPTTTTLTNGLSLLTGSLFGPTSDSSASAPGQSGDPQVAQSVASHHHAGAIVGGVVGWITFVLVLLSTLFWCRRRRSRLASPDVARGMVFEPTPPSTY